MMNINIESGSKESPELTEYPGMEEDYLLSEEDLEWEQEFEITGQ